MFPIDDGTDPTRQPDYKGLAVFFLIAQFFIITEYIYHPGSWHNIFWYCNHTSLLYAFACYTKRPQMIVGLLQVGIFGQLFWIVGFFGKLFNINPLSVADYLFIGPFDYVKVIALSAHLVVPVVAILTIIRMIRPKLISLVYSYAYLIGIYIVTWIFTKPEQNIDCAFTPCLSFLPQWHYRELIIVYAFLLVTLVFGVLYRITLYKKTKKLIKIER